MKIDDTGKHYVLPIIGRFAIEVECEKFPVLYFPDETYVVTLELCGDFRIVYNQEEDTYKALNNIASSIIHTFLHVEILDARANKYGMLFIRFADKRELIIDDGPYENWHFYARSKDKYRRNIHLGGGVGQTFLFT